jgi:hypothetical protein
MRGAIAVVAACLGIAAVASGADKKPAELIVGRWALVVADATPAPAAAAKPAAKPSAGKSGRTTARGKAPAKPKAPEPLPKFVLEFTKDGKVRLDGETSVVPDPPRFLKPLADTMVRADPRMKSMAITYRFADDGHVEVATDHSWLIDKLGGLPDDPAKAAEVTKTFRPREKLTVAATAKELTLTDEAGKEHKFRRFASPTPLADLEAKQRDADMRAGFNGPIGDILRQQGITVPGDPPKAAPKGKTVPKRSN